MKLNRGIAVVEILRFITDREKGKGKPLTTQKKSDLLVKLLKIDEPVLFVMYYDFKKQGMNITHEDIKKELGMENMTEEDAKQELNEIFKKNGIKKRLK